MNFAEVAAPSARPAGAPFAAPLRRRMAAFMYEGVLLFGVLFGTGLFMVAVVMRLTHTQPARESLMAGCFLVLGLYFVGFWVRNGQTLAMKTWHLRIVTASGAPLSAWRALARYIAAWVWFLPPLALAHAMAPHSERASYGLPLAWVLLYALSSRLHPRRQFWHDALCGTAVVHAPPPAAPARPA